jgi:hypothetical protein
MVHHQFIIWLQSPSSSARFYMSDFVCEESSISAVPVFKDAKFTYSASFETHTKCSRMLKLQGLQRQTIVVSMEIFCKELDDRLEFLPISLEDISRFYDLIISTCHSSTGPQNHIIFCTGPVHRIQFGTVFLLGCYMLICGLNTEEVGHALIQFERTTGRFQCNGMSCHDFWSAIYRVMKNRWVTFGEVNLSDPSMDTNIEIEEYLHYSRSQTLLFVAFPLQPRLPSQISS